MTTNHEFKMFMKHVIAIVYLLFVECNVKIPLKVSLHQIKSIDTILHILFTHTNNNKNKKNFLLYLGKGSDPLLVSILNLRDIIIIIINITYYTFFAAISYIFHVSFLKSLNRYSVKRISRRYGFWLSWRERSEGWQRYLELSPTVRPSLRLRVQLLER